MRFGGALLAVCFASLTTEAATFVRLQSQPGDSTAGGGQRIEYLDPKAYSMTVVPNSAGGVDFIRQLPCPSICASTPDTTQVQFAPAAGQAFVAGTYSSAQRFTRIAGARPGLLADERTREADRCASIAGSFVVLEIARASDGTVLRFAADFEQHCNGQAPALVGAVRFNSEVPYVQPPFAPAALRFTSEPGDPVGAGFSGSFLVLDGQTSTVASVRGAVVLQLRDPFGTTRLLLDISSGSADPLHTGAYSNNVRVTFDGRTCSAYATTSSFVYEIEWSPENMLQHYAADFTVQCVGASGVFSAGVRYNSTVPYIPPDQKSAVGNFPNGGSFALTYDAATSTCVLTAASLVHPDFAPLPVPAPKYVAYPFGYMSFNADNCGVGREITFHIDTPDVLPPTAQWWQYGATYLDPSPHWFPIPSSVSGNRISFTIIDGAAADNLLLFDGNFKVQGLIAFPGGVTQDLWWSGAAENGWGLSLVQHRDILFGNVFVYDAAGAATWYVMPSGSWDATHTVYTGALYLPKGSPFFAYDASRFDIGASVGSMRLIFADANHAAFDYTINGVTGHKDIVHIPFGPTSPPTDVPYGDLWWAGVAQNGWGIALHQQFASLFGLWFTYDANGKATWFVMPSGEWAARGDYRGKIYRVVGPPWLGVPYDASRHRTIEAGTFRFNASGDNAATFEYSVDGRSGSIPLSRIPF